MFVGLIITSLAELLVGVGNLKFTGHVNVQLENFNLNIKFISSQTNVLRRAMQCAKSKLSSLNFRPEAAL